VGFDPQECPQQDRPAQREADVVANFVLVARAGFLERAKRIAEADPLAIAFSRPVDAEAARWQFGQIAALTPREFVGFSERQNLAARALDCLAKLGNTANNLYDLRRAEEAVLAGLLVPRLSGHAVAVLANLGTQASQQALVELASRFVNPLAIRQAGASAFRYNVQRYGLLLGQEAIRVQYTRYNQSAAQDTATQKVLASILTTIESRATPSILEAAKKGAAPQKPIQTKRPGKAVKP